MLTAGEANVFDTLEPADLADAYPLLVGLIMGRPSPDAGEVQVNLDENQPSFKLIITLI